MAKTTRKFRSPAEIHQVLADLRNSGLSQRQFARQNKIPLSTLSNWLRKQRMPQTPVSSPEVIPVGTLGQRHSWLELEFPGGAILRFCGDRHDEDLALVLAELCRC